MIQYNPLDTLMSFKKLQDLPKVDIGSVLEKKRIESYSIHGPDGFLFNYAMAPVDESILMAMQDLADDR